MYRVYECDPKKKAEIIKILEADPYAEDSFARVGYKVKDGEVLGEDKAKLFIYISAAGDFVKKADAKLKDVASIAKADLEKRVVAKIQKEEEEAESGFGSIFGQGCLPGFF